MSGEVCGHPGAALPVQGFHHRASSWKGVFVTCQGIWEGLGTAGTARPGEMQGKSS